MSSAANELFDRLRDVENNNLRNELAIGTHEKECAIRYGYIHSTLKSIERNQRWAIITGLTGMGGILVKMLFFP